MFIPVYAFLFLPILSAVKSDTRNFMERTGTIQWGLMVTVFCISHIPALLNLSIPGHEDRNAFLIVFLVLIVQGGDILHHICSRFFGKHQIAPQVSPSKTVEGFIGGIATVVVLGALLSWMTPFSPGEAALVTLATTLMAISAGAVFMGANTYIGNAPNFMVKAVAESRGVNMPGFFGYMLWSGCVLLPVFALVTWVFFR